MSNELDLSILKTLVTNKKHALDFANECDSKLFNSEIWNFANLAVSYIRTYKDVPTQRVMIDKLSKGNNEKVIEHVKKIWAQLDQVQANDSEYKYDLEKIKKRFSEKQVTMLKESLLKQDAGSMDISKIVGDIHKTVQSIKSVSEAKAYERKTLKQFLPAFKEKFNAKKNNPKVDAGLMTGYSYFDFATNGVRAADFVIIAGESGFGKSLFLNNMAVQVWMQGNTLDTIDFAEGKNVVYFSLEMPYEDCFIRLLSRLSNVPSRKIEVPSSIDKEELQKIKKALDFIERYPYHFEIIDIADASAQELDVILNDIPYVIDGVFIDYLGIMKPNEKVEEADWLKQGIIAYEIRAIGRKRALPIFSAVQLNRKNLSKESSENIGLSRLARSATIATHATHVIQIENRPNEENFSDFLYHLIKNRKGPKGKGRLIKDLKCASLLDDKIGGKNTEDKTFFSMHNSDDISDRAELFDI